MIKSFGKFKHYKTDSDNVMYAKNETGIDWYTIAHDLTYSDGVWIMVNVDNLVVAGNVDKSRLWPANFSVFLIEGDTDAKKYLGKVFDGKTFTDQSEKVPTSLTKSNLLLTLLENDPQILESDISKKINYIKNDAVYKEKLRILLNAVTWKRDSILISFIQEKFELTTEVMDQLFINASKL
jgi:hypothetical protein